MKSSELLFKNVLTEKSESNKMKEKKRKEGKYYLKSNPFVLPFDEKYVDKILFKLQLYDCGMYFQS